MTACPHPQPCASVGRCRFDGDCSAPAAPHPALALIKAGLIPEAIAYLKAINDPRLLGATALLEKGWTLFAVWILEDLPPHVVARAPVFRCAECEAIWRTGAQRDLCCTAGVEPMAPEVVT